LLARIERGQFSLELPFFELRTQPFELLVPDEPLQRARFGRVHQPYRLGAEGCHGDERIEGERRGRQSAREQRDVVRIRERELQKRRSRAELIGSDCRRFGQFRNSHDRIQYKFVMRSTALAKVLGGQVAAPLDRQEIATRIIGGAQDRGNDRESGGCFVAGGT
jgi:hypothetical protein